MKTALFVFGKIALFIVWSAEIAGLCIDYVFFKIVPAMFWECITGFIILVYMFFLTSLQLGKNDHSDG